MVAAGGGVAAASGAGAERRKESLRLLCLHGHGGFGKRLCDQLEKTFLRMARSSPGKGLDDLDVECRCIDAPLAETSRRKEGRQWWRYDEGGNGDRPEDWAEMEVAALKIAQELEKPDRPYDGVLGFSQGAEMVHTVALLAHRGDPRFTGPRAPRFGVSLSGAVNPGHFEAVGGGGPPRDCLGPTAGPHARQLRMPMLFLGDFKQDSWYPAHRFESTLDLYADAVRVEHAQRHTIPELSSEAGDKVRGFFRRFAAASRM